MLIYSASGATSTTDQRAEKPINGVGFVISGTGIDGSELVTIRKIGSNSGAVDICTQAKLIDLLEINAQGEGSFINSSTLMKGIVKITPDITGVNLTSDEYIVVTMTGMNSSNTYSFYGMETPVYGDKILQYNPVTQNTTPKTYDVTNVVTLAMNKTNVTELLLTYENGKSVILKPTELELHALDDNDIVTANASLAPTIAGYLNLYVVNTDRCVQAQLAITQNTTAQVYLLAIVNG